MSRGTGGQWGDKRENKNDESTWHATLGGGNVGVSEDLLVAEEAATASGYTQLERSGTGE
jgi:hypothetical protein